MIIDKIENWRRFERLGERFTIAFRFLETEAKMADHGNLTRRQVSGDAVVATLSSVTARGAHQAVFEWHERFADIHVCLEGEERFGWQEGKANLLPERPFDPQKDVGTFRGSAEFTVPLRRGYFALVMPGELHAPALGSGILKKWVIKVLCATAPETLSPNGAEAK